MKVLMSERSMFRTRFCRTAGALVAAAAFVILPIGAQGAGCADGQSRFLYWVGADHGSMERIDLVTGDSEFLYDGKYLLGIDVDAVSKKLWWVERFDTSTQPSTKVYEGNHVVSIYDAMTNGQYMTDVAVDPVGGKYYLTRTSGGTRSYFLSGGQEHIFANQNSVGVTLDLAGGRVYWSENESGGAFDEVHSAKLDNTDTQYLFTVTNVKGLAVDTVNGKLYAAAQGSGLTPGPLVRSNLDGSQLEPVFVTGVSGDASKGLDAVIDAAAGKLYWSNEANQILSIDLPATLPIPYALATLVQDSLADRPRGLALSCADLCAFSVPSTETVRLGTPPNPAAFLPGATNGPAIGAIWDPVVDHTTFVPGALFDFVAISSAGINLSLPPLGTLLCDPAPPSFQVTGPTGVPFALTVPDDCTIVGTNLCTQGGSIDPLGGIRFANALDIVIGTH